MLLFYLNIYNHNKKAGLPFGNPAVLFLLRPVAFRPSPHDGCGFINSYQSLYLYNYKDQDSMVNLNFVSLPLSEVL